MQRPVTAAGLTTCKCLKKKTPSHNERSSSVNNPVSHPNAGEYSFWARCQEQRSQKALNCCSHSTDRSQGRQRYEKSSRSGTRARPCTHDTCRRLASSRLATGEGAFQCCQAETTFWAARLASCSAGLRAAARGRTELQEAPSHRGSSTALAAPRASKRALTAEHGDGHGDGRRSPSLWGDRPPQLPLGLALPSPVCPVTLEWPRSRLSKANTPAQSLWGKRKALRRHRNGMRGNSGH